MTPPPCVPEQLPPLVPMTPTPLSGARPPTGLGDIREDPWTMVWLEPILRTAEPMGPAVEPNSPVDEEVGPPTAMLLLLQPAGLRLVEVLAPPRGTMFPEATA